MTDNATLLDNSSSINASEATTVILILENSGLLVFEYLKNDNSAVTKVATFKTISDFNKSDCNIEKTIVFVADSKLTLIPKFMVEEAIDSVGLFNFELANDAVLKEDLTYDEQVVILYPLPKKTSAFIEQISNSKGLHLGCELIAYLSKTKQDTLLLVVINENLFIGLQQQKKLQLFNSYAVKNTEEVLYYTMLVVQEFKIDPTTITIDVAGDFNKSGDLAVQLKNYFLSVTDLQHPSIENKSISGILKILTS